MVPSVVPIPDAHRLRNRGLIVQMAQENATWGYDRIAGALANVGHNDSDQTIGNVLKQHGIAPAPKRSQSTTWTGLHFSTYGGACRRGFLHPRGADLARLATYYVLFFLHLKPGGSPSVALPATWLFGQPVRRRMSIQRRSIAFSTAGIPLIGGCLKFLESLAVL